MDPKKPVGRQKNVLSGGGKVQKRGEGLHTGPVGTGTNPKTRPSNSSYQGSGRASGGMRASGGKSPLLIIVVIVITLLGGGGGLSSLLGGLGSYSSSDYGNYSDYSSNSSAGVNASSQMVDTSVAAGSRAKYTTILGNNQDVFTIMVYMCGTDLESKYGMATNDLTEMTRATYGDNINLIVYTGGCTSWRNQVVSNKKNQIYQIKDGKMILLKEEAAVAMTKPETLTSFIQYASSNYPANRYGLILWDHGGGSVTGYGYDEKFASSGSMSLSGINKALASAGLTYDFIGFDACLMATLENGLMLSDYCDYMIASEETEPGVGWYYTNWLTKLGANTSMSTVELGKNIVDDFVSVCATSARGQKTTLSVVDLAELSHTVPEELNSFAQSTSQLISNNQYEKVANARAGSREFAQSSKIDQIDLVNLANNMGTKEGQELSEALQGAVKYNKTSSNVTNAYGLSIYFPCKKLSKVDSAVSTYEAIGMDDDYSNCIKQFASMEVVGQAAAGGSYTANPLESLLGGSAGSSQYTSSFSSGDITSLIGNMLLSSAGNSLGLDPSVMNFFSRGIPENAAEYIASNHLDAGNLYFTKQADGTYTMPLTDAEWSLLTDVEINIFVDDGTGYIDLGLDNTYEVNENDDLVASTDATWLSINGEIVAYYHLSTEGDADDYTITGYVPAMLNGERVNLILVFDSANPNGYIAGATSDYQGSIDVEAKALGELEDGDNLEFLCDYYSYSGEYQDSYYLGNPVTISGTPVIGDLTLTNDSYVITYCLTDIYGQKYWIPLEQ
ncbi:MAG: peptidase C11 [Lachnospiraceae bacterium]|nr:peptidase C11 [Lachnospiraceae bacterium]